MLNKINVPVLIKFFNVFKNVSLQTYIGNVVVSINPYRKFNLYTPEVIAEYRSRNIYELPPHMYVDLIVKLAIIIDLENS